MLYWVITFIYYLAYPIKKEIESILLLSKAFQRALVDFSGEISF